jgi:hypothetical protein
VDLFNPPRFLRFAGHLASYIETFLVEQAKRRAVAFALRDWLFGRVTVAWPSGGPGWSQSLAQACKFVGEAGAVGFGAPAGATVALRVWPGFGDASASWVWLNSVPHGPEPVPSPIRVARSCVPRNRARSEVLVDSQEFYAVSNRFNLRLSLRDAISG